MTLFYDTNVLLSNAKDCFSTVDKFYISNITINELENIKSSANKDLDIKYEARKLLHMLEENEDKYEIILFKEEYSRRMSEFDLPVTADSKIIASAFCYFEDNNITDGVFCTKDLACKAIAKSIGLNVSSYIEKKEDNYTGFIEIELTEEEMAKVYMDTIPLNINKYSLLENQYLLLKDKTTGKVIDKYKWCGNAYHQVQFNKFNSKMFGQIAPKDEYQLCAMDSMKSNTVTLLGGPAGSGKTFLALGYLFSELERDRISKIVIFCNPVGARGAARLGFYKGTVLEKLLATQVGHVLTSKLGGEEEVEYLIQHNMLEIIPAVDARGYETPPDAGVYILESRNLTSDLMRLLLQRVSDTSCVIIDGDRREQLDLAAYAEDNGMTKVSEVFRGEDVYGQIDLQKIYRSRIAEIAERMKE